MISAMGRPDGSRTGNFLLLDQDLKVKGKWAEEDTAFGYGACRWHVGFVRSDVRGHAGCGNIVCEVLLQRH